jgi:glutaminase
MDYSTIGIHKKDIRFKNNQEKNSFTEKYNCGMLKIRDFDKLKEIVNKVYNSVKSDNDGNVADYIPQLKNVDSDLFGVVLVTVDGQVIEIGDTYPKFCVQSCSKPINYGIALDTLNKDIVHNFVGKEPSGRNFNELCLNQEKLPHNPLINSGAIMTTSLIHKELPTSNRFEKVYNYWKDLTCNTHLSFNNSVYLSEKDTADRNYCLGYMMQEKGSFLGINQEITTKIGRKWNHNDLNINLELYFQFCSIESNLLGMGLLSATLANSGIHPWSYKKIFTSNTVKNILSIMSACGMYDYSGEWNYEIGVPAKSGVSGLIYTVIPGLCGIATYSPKLDKLGNSYRGVNFFKLLSKKLNIHKYEDKNSNELLIIDRNENTNIKTLNYLFLDGCYHNNLDLVKECISKGCNINFQDYDKRTALHIAAEENHREIIDYLMDNNADLKIKDRWNKSPDDILKK